MNISKQSHISWLMIFPRFSFAEGSYAGHIKRKKKASLCFSINNNIKSLTHYCGKMILPCLKKSISLKISNHQFRILVLKKMISICGSYRTTNGNCRHFDSWHLMWECTKNLQLNEPKYCTALIFQEAGECTCFKANVSQQ